MFHLKETTKEKYDNFLQFVQRGKLVNIYTLLYYVLQENGLYDVSIKCLWNVILWNAILSITVSWQLQFLCTGI